MRLAQLIASFYIAAVVRGSPAFPTPFNDARKNIGKIGEQQSPSRVIADISDTDSDSSQPSELLMINQFEGVSNQNGTKESFPSHMTGEWTIDIDHLRMPIGLREHLEGIERREHGARDICTKGGRGHIYFVDPYPADGENYVYHLQTQWKLIYPTQLKNKLRKQGFTVLDRPHGMGCDVWDPLFTVKETSVVRGSIELNWPESHSAVLQYHMKPWVLNDWVALHTILEETYPGLEIIMTVIGSFLLAGVVGFASRVGYGWACKRYGWHDRTQDYWQWRRQWVRSRGAELN